MSTAELTTLSTVELNKEIVRRYVEDVNLGRLDAFDELVIPDYVDHDALPGQAPGREGLKAAYAGFIAAFSDIWFVLEDVIGEDDLVVARGTITGTNDGLFMGLPATGNKFAWTGTRTFRLKDGLLTEGWINLDFLAILNQLGVAPPLDHRAA